MEGALRCQTLAWAGSDQGVGGYLRGASPHVGGPPLPALAVFTAVLALGSLEAAGCRSPIPPGSNLPLYGGGGTPRLSSCFCPTPYDGVRGALRTGGPQPGNPSLLPVLHSAQGWQYDTAYCVKGSQPRTSRFK